MNIATGAFTLACASSTGIALSYPASGTTISIDTGSALVHEDTCTFSIDETLVTDADGAQLVAFAPIDFTVATDNSGAYYDQVNDSSPGQLRCTLHETINDHTVYPYSGSGTSAWTILELAEEHPTDSSKIIDGYRNRVYTKVSDRAGTGSGITYNREHSWPNSLGFGSSGWCPTATPTCSTSPTPATTATAATCPTPTARKAAAAAKTRPRPTTAAVAAAAPIRATPTGSRAAATPARSRCGTRARATSRNGFE